MWAGGPSRAQPWTGALAVPGSSAQASCIERHAATLLKPQQLAKQGAKVFMTSAGARPIPIQKHALSCPHRLITAPKAPKALGKMLRLLRRRGAALADAPGLLGTSPLLILVGVRGLARCCDWQAPPCTMSATVQEPAALLPPAGSGARQR